MNYAQLKKNKSLASDVKQTIIIQDIQMDLLKSTYNVQIIPLFTFVKNPET